MGPWAFFVYGAGNSVAGRVLQHVFPTPLEKAQLHNLHEQVRLARERLVEEERRAQRDLDQRWAMLREQLEHQQSLQRERIEADRRLRDYQKQLDSWPLAVMAANIVDVSRRSPHPALNVIVKVTRGHGQHAPLGPLLRAVASLDRLVRIHCGDDLFLYSETAPPKDLRAEPLSQRSLISTLNGVLHSEATALLEVIPGDGQIEIDGAFWGWTCEGEDDRGTAIRARQPLMLELPQAEAAAEARIVNSLLLMIVAISDTHALLSRWGVAPRLNLFRVLAEIARNDPILAAGGAVLIEQLAAQIERLAGSAPALAAEAAARAAIAAHEAGFGDHAAALLGVALDHERKAISAPPPDEPGLIRALMAVPASRRGIVQDALALLKNATSERLEPPDRPPLREVIAAAARHLREQEQR